MSIHDSDGPLNDVKLMLNYLTIDRKRPKQKFHQNQVEELAEKIREFEEREKIHSRRIELLKEEVETAKRNIGLVAEVFERLPSTELTEGKVLGALRRLETAPVSGR